MIVIRSLLVHIGLEFFVQHSFEQHCEVGRKYYVGWTVIRVESGKEYIFKWAFKEVFHYCFITTL